jgi:hypothetical protein
MDDGVYRLGFSLRLMDIESCRMTNILRSVFCGDREGGRVGEGEHI